ncbi:metallophosphoesterase [Nitritalea halalkaliphila LW7]|uniref:Metallophosphoesterase n=1 Tax=Nitritalea halalkaliphila LW7 TaxID=1189621 RepID=I5C919_9BACT|nr:UDP-2,3-diacylglucosamine diphosphatase [Nitritalea halalkaliphila]EIM78321.1 metallophosphoesterase [Nitritalea halalkaliphila LW7]
MKLTIPEGKRVYFASDFHLGAPDFSQSKAREEKICRWLERIRTDAAALFLVGDIFDFWFEYKHVVPKGFIPFLGKLADLRQEGLPIYLFTGNHDLWMQDYFPTELGIPVFHQPQSILLNDTKLLVGHGDGLGPGDRKYKVLKKFFTNPACRWLFRWLHPDVGMQIALNWSSSSRASNALKNEDFFRGPDEWLWAYAQQIEAQEHFPYYVFGHRHLPLDLPVGKAAAT